MKTFRFILIVATLLLPGLATSNARAGQSDSHELIELALDEPTRITLKDIKLSDALQAIWDQTGVRVVMPAEVMRLAPYGGETLIERVEVSDIPLREGLTRLLAPLGMTFAVRDKYVEVVAREALRCLGRRPTWEELQTLGELSAMQPGVDAEALAQLRSRVQFRVPVPNGWITLAQAMESVGAGPGDEVLGVACASLGWSWCLSGRQVVISSAAAQITARMQQPISLRINFRPLVDVLQAVGHKAGITVRAEPDAVRSLPVHMQKNFSLNVHQKSAEEIFDAIAANTGLGYLVEPDAVLFYSLGDSPPLSSVTQSSPEAQPVRDPYVGRISVELEDGRTMEWLIRQSELPPDLSQRRKEDLQKAFDALRR